MAYHPTNMTISLLPVISEDGRELHWENQQASVGYVLDIDQVLCCTLEYFKVCVFHNIHACVVQEYTV